MESENILADDVQVRGPVFAEILALPVNIVAQRRDLQLDGNGEGKCP